MAVDQEPRSGSGRGSKRDPSRKALTIGAVCKILRSEFPDISISKLRYLEDQKLLSPRRTPGGYRLYSQTDVERLRAILHMQRDEFLPLRVIRQELSAGQARDRKSKSGGSHGAVARAVSVAGDGAARIGLEELLEDTGASNELVRELADFGLIEPKVENGESFYNDTDREIVRAATELARYGVEGRNLRVFRTSVDREAALLQQLMGAALQSKNPARHRDAVETLESLAGICNQLKHLLLVRDLRNLTG
jgi:DNA-binding transcriptional MerR regulator